MQVVFEDVFISEGYNRSLLIDLTRAKYFLIPSEWGIYIKSNNRISCFSKFLKEDPEFYYFLEKNELLFNIDIELLDNFPILSYNYEKPSVLQVLFIQISKINYKSVLLLFDLKEISSIGVIKLYFDTTVSLNKVKFLLDKIYNFQPGVSLIVYTETPISLKEKYPFILQNNFENNEFFSFFQILENDLSFPVFISNTDQLSESSKYNVFVNGVIFIDRLGYMYFGDKKNKFHIDDRIIVDKLKCIQEEKSQWNIPLTKVEICKICEFNRICIDSRIPYVQGNTWGKADCSYNPYLSLWSSEDKYIKSSDSGTIDVDGNFIINIGLIENILSI